VLQRLGQPPGCLELLRQRELLDRSAGQSSGTAERVDRRAAFRQGAGKISGQLGRVGRPSVGGSGAGHLARTTVSPGDVGPDRGGGVHLPAQFRAVRQSLQGRHASRRVLGLRPHAERPAGQPARVAVGVHRAVLLRRGEQQRTGLLRSVRGDPVLRDDGGVGPSRAQRIRRSLVQQAAAGPRDAAVQRLPDQGVSEDGELCVVLDQQPGVEQCVDLAGSDEVGEHRKVDVHAERRCVLDAAVVLRAQRRRAGEHRVEHRLRQREDGVVPQLQFRAVPDETVAVDQRRGELLDEEGKSLRPFVHCGGE
jgi:hypothetical protein